VDISAPFRDVSVFLNSFLVDRDYLDPTARIRSGLIERIGKDPVKPIQRLQKGNDKDKRKNERRRYHFFYYRFAFHRTPPYSYLSFFILSHGRRHPAVIREIFLLLLDSLNPDDR
jgi:hypothetical protein